MLGDPEPIDDHLDAVKDVIGRYCAPAKDAGAATEMLTTEQFFSCVENEIPGIVDKTVFREVLIGLGFCTQRIGADIYWLLRRP